MKKKNFELLPDLDHSKVKYDPFNQNFYNEHPEISSMPIQEVVQIRKERQIKLKGSFDIQPVVSFGHLGFDEQFLFQISKHGFSKPTPIQSQALPCILSGFDLIGIAQTGSGKTLAYVWPLLLHILDQRELGQNEGPIGIILCPTRELAQQVYLETQQFSKIYNITVGALLGGENQHEQWKLLQHGVQILIATPGRLMEMMKKQATNTGRCTYLVIDEADQMFSMGFEKQVRSIIGQTRPDRQTLFFSATFKKKIKHLAMDCLSNPLTITVGNEDQANDDVKQEAVILKDVNAKLRWILDRLVFFLTRGKVLIFVNQIATCAVVASAIEHRYMKQVLVLNGDLMQQQRTNIINRFKTDQNEMILVATDIASRGLDVAELQTVINYQVPKDADTHIHRVGRTGRAGNKDGEAYTLLLEGADVKFAGILIKSMEMSGQPVTQNLENLAANDDQFKIERMTKQMGLDFSKGKDASKLLKQALNRGRNNRFGLGYKQDGDESSALKNSFQKETDNIFEAKRLNYSNIPQVMVTPRVDDITPLIHHAVEIPQTIVDNQGTGVDGFDIPVEKPKRKSQFSSAPVFEESVEVPQFSQNHNIVSNDNNSRESIMDEFRNTQKIAMQAQFRNSFVSAGKLQNYTKEAKITYGKNQ